MTRMITFVGARGGQGTSTVAAAAALFAATEQRTVLVSDDPAATAALIGIPLPLGGDCIAVTPTLTLTTRPELHPAAQVVVIDAGRLTTAASSRHPTLRSRTPVRRPATWCCEARATWRWPRSSPPAGRPSTGSSC